MYKKIDKVHFILCMNLYSLKHCLKYSLNAICRRGRPMLGKRQNLRGRIWIWIWIWMTASQWVTGSWQFKVTHFIFNIPALLMPLLPSRRHYILLKNPELITQLCSNTPQKTTTTPQKHQESRAAQYVANEVWGRNEHNGATASSFSAHGKMFKSHCKNPHF